MEDPGGQGPDGVSRRKAEPGGWPVGPGDAERGWGHPAWGQGRLGDRCGQGLSNVQG